MGGEHRPAGGVDLTWAGTLFGTAVALVGISAAVGAALLFGTVAPGVFAHGGGVGPAVGPIMLATQAMRAAPSRKTQCVRWLVASLPVAAASTLGAGLAGIAVDGAMPTAAIGFPDFIFLLIGGVLAAVPALALVLRWIGPGPEIGSDAKDGKP